MSKEDSGSSGGSRRRRRSRSRKRSNSRKGGRKNSRRRSSGRNRHRNSGGKGRGRRNSRRKGKTPESKFGGREPRSNQATDNGPLELNAFELFCAYHLGIAADNRFKKQSLQEVAGRFRSSPDEIRDALEQYHLDTESLRKIGYDLELARLDVKVAPDGIDKKEIARPLFDELTSELDAIS